jgi:phosphatidate cytidylyltransferase
VAKRLWQEGSNAGLLFYFVLIVQLGDVFQYAWGQFLGRRVIAPEINASRTWEGFFGGVASTTLVGGLLWWATPFRLWEAACLSLVTAVMGFAGGITMSAIKRDRGVTDYGTLVQGHAGVLDRIDSICFAAPVFFHLTRYYFSEQAF